MNIANGQMTDKYYNILPVDADTCKILLYGYVSSYSEDVNSKSFANEFAEAESKYNNIQIRINSGGGDVFEGIAIFNTIRASSKNITIYIDGVAASIAGIIALCGKPVKMNRYSMLMLHRVTGGGWGDADKMRKSADDMEKVEGVLVDIMANATGMTVDEVKKQYMDGTEHWFTADEALRGGLVNEVFYGVKVDPPTGIINNVSTGSNRVKLFFNQFNTLLTQQKMKILWQKLGLKNESDEAEAVNAVEKLEADLAAERASSEAYKKEIGDLKKKLQAFEDKAAADRKAQIDTILTDAVKTGRIQEAQKPAFKALLEKDFENGKSAIEGLHVQNRMIDLLNAKSQNDPFKDYTFSDYQKKAPKALATMKAENPDEFKALYKAEFGKEPKI